MSAGAERYDTTTSTFVRRLVVDELVEQVDGRPARPVQIVESRAARGCSRGELGDGADHGAEQPRPLGVGVAVAGRQRQAELGGAARDQAGELGCPGAEAVDRPSAGSTTASTWSSASANGWYGTVCSSEHVPYSTVAAAAWTCRANSVSSRVLPAPASPGTSNDLAGARGGRRPRLLERRSTRRRARRAGSSRRASAAAAVGSAAAHRVRCHRPIVRQWSIRASRYSGDRRPERRDLVMCHERAVRPYVRPA